MASPAELTFIAAVAAAEAARQATKSVAWGAYSFIPSNYPNYVATIALADVTYLTAVNTARNTAALPLGLQGNSGPIPTTWASLIGGM